MRRYCLAVLFFAAVPAFAQTTIVETRLGQLKRVTPPERLTFGPEDHFQGSRSPDGRYLLFTRKLNLTPELRRLDLASRETEELGTEFANAEQAQYSPDGKRFLFLRPSARAGGEICWREAAGGKVSCFTGADGEKQFPFWLGNDRIGYVAKGLRSEVRAFTLAAADANAETLLAGSFLHPAAAPNGDLALVEKVAGGRTRLVLRRAGQTCDAPMAWPGAVAFPSFSPGGETIVFSAYLTDSNRDGKIDVNDRSLVAAVAADALCGKQPFVPRPLTSIEKDCGHARLSAGLDLTCAFEGSLDLYQLPAEGQLPAGWTAADWRSAHASARGPEERLFVLLALAARAPDALSSLATRLWIQYLLLDDDAGALGWFPRAADEQKLTPAARELWQAYFRAGLVRKSEPPGELSLVAKQELRELAAGVARQPASVLRAATLARIAAFAGDRDGERRSVATLLKMKTAALPEILVAGLRWEESRDPAEEKYLGFLTANVDPRNPEALPLWVKALERLEGSPARRKTVETLVARLPPGAVARELGAAELLNLDVAEGKKSAYLDFDRKFVSLREKPALLRAVAYRAIRSWTKADRTEMVPAVASNLLKYLENPGLEYTAAYDYYLSSTFDRAYEMERASNPRAAVGHFYGAVTLTDDLEAHWGYLRDMVAAGLGDDIKAQLDELVKRNFTKALEPRVRALAALARKDPRRESEGELGDLADTLEKLPGANHAVARFLQGSLRLLQLMAKPWRGGEAQLRDGRAIYRDLTLALDGARDNERLKIAVLDNLAILQSHTRQWGEAAKAWAQRGRHGYEAPGDGTVARWYEAQAHFHLADYARATELLRNARVEQVPAEWRVPYFHRMALYAGLAQEHAVSLAAAEQALASGTTGRSAATMKLLRGRAQLLLGKKADAAKTLAGLWGELAGLPEDATDAANERPTDDRPWGGSLRRLKILVSGFLLQASDEARWWEERERALDMTVARAKTLGFTGDAFFELRLKTALGLLAVGKGTVESRLDRALEDLEGHAAEAGVVASVAWFETVNGLMVHALAGPPLSPARRALLAEKANAFVASAEKVPYPSPLLWSQLLRLKATAFVFNGGVDRAEQTRALLASVPMKSLREQSPALAAKTEQWLRAPAP